MSLTPAPKGDGCPAAEPALSRLRVTQAAPLSYRMLVGEGSPQQSWREAGARTDLVPAAGWGCTRAQTECDSGSVCRLLSPALRGSCGQHRQNLPGDCCFLFPKTTLDVVGVPPPLFPSCRSPAGRFNLCVPVSASSVFFFFLQGSVLGFSSFSGQCLSSGLPAA